MTTVTVVGEALVDIVERGELVEVLPGGSPLNVAVGLARLGVDVSLIARLGSDAHGDTVRRHAHDAGVDTTPIQHAPRTSSARAVLAPDGSAHYEFDLEWRLDPLDSVRGRLLHSGSAGAWLAPGEEVVAGLFASRREDQLASLDPNIRPRLIDDRDGVGARVRRLAASADVVKLSDEDAEWLYPGMSAPAVLDSLLELGASLAVITRAAEGCIAATATHRVSRPARPTTVVDTIGAGDSFMSGLLSGLLKRRVSRGAVGQLAEADLEQLVDFALACAAITVGRRGAEPPTMADVRASAPQLVRDGD